jgi:exodeoxyribonuclease VII small subunit
MKKERLTFEESMKRLEEIVKLLETPELPLQETYDLYEEGMKLTMAMRRELNEIEKKVKILQQKNSEELEEVDFASADGEEVPR